MASSFRTKPDKKQPTKVHTFDSIHSEHLDKFQHADDILIPELREKITQKYELIASLSNKEKSKKKDLEREIRGIEREVQRLQNEKNDYFLTNSEHIFNYFEHKQLIASDNTTAVQKPQDDNGSIYEFFKMKPKNNNNPPPESTESSIQRYLHNVNHSTDNLTILEETADMEKCKNCNSGELIPLEEEGILVCNNCSVCIAYFIDNDKPSYKEPPKEISSYAYKRINHFKELLLQFQAKETVNIPDSVMDIIRAQITRERIDVTKLNYASMKDILKRLGYSKLYDHIMYILTQFDIPAPNLSNKLTETLLNLFTDLQEPFARHMPNTRKSFLKHYYTLYKLCELLGEKQLLPLIPLLEDRNKIIEHDAIWKNMCGDLDWPYEPTI
tara:strand:- start:168 stop:1322 length:1155 start_codon:yes stop_codon:yes gene_type:complete